MIGALQYLTYTKPEIAYTVSRLSQYMHTPNLSHLTAAKSVLRYLAGTSTFGLLFKKFSTVWNINEFSDSDCRGNTLDQRSTTGFVIFLGENPIYRVAKKQSTVSRS